MHADIAIIGGGLVGLCSAFQLAKAGKRVIVLEKDFIGRHASGVNAGGIRFLKRDLRELPVIYDALQMWHTMQDIVGSDCGFYKTGYIIVAENDTEMEELARRVETTQALGYTMETLLDKKALQNIVPVLSSRCVGGIMSSRDGHASPFATCQAFYGACIQQGALVFTHCKVTDITTTSQGFSIQTTTQGTIQAEQVLNAAGAWAGQLAAMLGETLPVTPVGPSVLVTAPAPRMLRHFLTCCNRKLWFNQARNNSILICGGYLAHVDMEKERTLLDFTELQKCTQVVKEVTNISSALQIVRAWAGIDGNTPDDIPIIDHSQKISGLTHACGFSKHGFALSPATGKIVSALMQGKQPSVAYDDFRLTRFQH